MCFKFRVVTTSQVQHVPTIMIDSDVFVGRSTVRPTREIARFRMDNDGPRPERRKEGFNSRGCAGTMRISVIERVV
jgi:hypothetical protein